MTLLDSITVQLPLERKAKFNQLFVELQKNTISAEHFLSQAKYLLDERGYQMLENLKSQTPQGNDDQTSARPTPLAIPEQQQQPKRSLSISQLRQEDSPRSSSSGVFQMKRPKLDPRSTSKSSSNLNIATPPSIATPSQTLESKQSQGVPPPQSTPSIKQPTPATSSGGDNRIDYDAITDVMGYAGVDLKEEAEHFIMKDGGGDTLTTDSVDRSKSQDFMNARLLQQVVDKLAKPLTIAHVDPDVVAYLSLATQDRLRGLVEDMVKASKHRIKQRSPFQRPPPLHNSGYPLYKVLVKTHQKQTLMALEKLDGRPMTTTARPSSWTLTNKKGTYPVNDDDTNQDRQVTVVDAIFALEREGQGGKGSGQRTLLKMYNQWLE
ncbi:transcription initiation factor TFIID component TAF4 family-domain-containing protein [Chlamydoabsidia padenii]|nr:transcription initiation factor TFIID component TAF4 family-domain-containing protein [Chlamydoabsidia padenii]